jgi:hypothetical protein
VAATPKPVVPEGPIVRFTARAGTATSIVADAASAVERGAARRGTLVRGAAIGFVVGASAAFGLALALLH